MGKTVVKWEGDKVRDLIWRTLNAEAWRMDYGDPRGYTFNTHDEDGEGMGYWLENPLLFMVKDEDGVYLTSNIDYGVEYRVGRATSWRKPKCDIIMARGFTALSTLDRHYRAIDLLGDRRMSVTMSMLNIWQGIMTRPAKWFRHTWFEVTIEDGMATYEFKQKRS